MSRVTLNEDKKLGTLIGLCKRAIERNAVLTSIFQNLGYGGSTLKGIVEIIQGYAHEPLIEFQPNPITGDLEIYEDGLLIDF